MEVDHFTFFRSYYEAIRLLPKREQAEAYAAIIRYGLTGELPPQQLPGGAAAVFTIALPSLDATRAKIAAGAAGGRKPKADGKQAASKQQAPAESASSAAEKQISVAKKQTPSTKDIDIDVDVDNDVFLHPSDACAEQPPASSAPAAQEETGLRLSLADGSFYAVTAEELSERQKAYPGVDVAQQLRQMEQWLQSNPRRRKTRSGVRAFITNWLNREQNHASAPRNEKRTYNSQFQRHDEPLSPMLIAAARRALDEEDEEDTP